MPKKRAYTKHTPAERLHQLVMRYDRLSKASTKRTALMAAIDAKIQVLKAQLAEPEVAPTPTVAEPSVG